MKDREFNHDYKVIETRLVMILMIFMITIIITIMMIIIVTMIIMIRVIIMIIITIITIVVITAIRVIMMIIIIMIIMISFSFLSFLISFFFLNWLNHSYLMLPLPSSTAAHFSEVFEATDVSAALAAGMFHRGEVAISEVKQHMINSGIKTRL